MFPGCPASLSLTSQMVPEKGKAFVCGPRDADVRNSVEQADGGRGKGGQGRCSHHVALPLYFCKPPLGTQASCSGTVQHWVGQLSWEHFLPPGPQVPSLSPGCVGANHTAPRRFFPSPGLLALLRGDGVSHGEILYKGLGGRLLLSV